VDSDLSRTVLGSTLALNLEERMPQPLSILPTTEEQSLNFRLWMGVLLPPFAGGVNTVVGYMVSNYSCSIHNRHLVLLVNLVTLGLCGASVLLSAPLRARIEQAANNSSRSLLDTRRLLLHLSYWFSVGFSLFILAGTISTFLLRPCDL
jgi:hypothetical protein